MKDIVSGPFCKKTMKLLIVEDEALHPKTA
jgi:hypothetical protein